MVHVHWDGTDIAMPAGDFIMLNYRFLPLLLLYSALSQAGVGSSSATTSNVHVALQDQKIEAQLIVNNFLQQLDEGEISLFGAALSRDMLSPVKVSREYQFDNDNTTIMIYSRLTQPMPMPEAEQYTVVGISVFMNQWGRIDQIKAHVQGDKP